MKPSLNPAALLLLVPALYVGGYFAFLALCSRNSHPYLPITMSNQISVVTGNHPVATRAAKIFRPAMRIHARLTKRPITLRSNAFS